MRNILVEQEGTLEREKAHNLYYVRYVNYLGSNQAKVDESPMSSTLEAHGLHHVTISSSEKLSFKYCYARLAGRYFKIADQAYSMHQSEYT